MRARPIPQEKDNFCLGGVVPPLKCIILRKQQTPQQHGAADLSTGAARHGESSASEWTHPPQGVTSAGGGRYGLSLKFFDHLLYSATVY